MALCAFYVARKDPVHGDFVHSHPLSSVTQVRMPVTPMIAERVLAQVSTMRVKVGYIGIWHLISGIKQDGI